jgi:hypothetical protein
MTEFASAPGFPFLRMALRALAQPGMTGEGTPRLRVPPFSATHHLFRLTRPASLLSHAQTVIPDAPDKLYRKNEWARSGTHSGV